VIGRGLGLAALALALAGCAAAPDGPRAAASSTGRFELFVLGRAQDGGLPHVGCDRETCCAAARRTGRVETPACLGIHDRETGALALIEATPAVERQLALLHDLAGSRPRGRQPVDAVFLTHAHIGHYLGLAHFGREVAATQGLPVYGTPRFLAFLRAHGPWQQLIDLGQIDPRPVEPKGSVELFGALTVEAIPVPHRDEYSDTVAYRIRGPERTVLFCPDVDAWGRHDGLLDQLLDGVDVAYLDATFYDGRELPERFRAEIPHPTMVDSMERLGARAAARLGSIRFLHLNHTNPAFHPGAIADSIRARGFGIAQVGERTVL
jgi:pyrroloquinoline quinone biosynthesis protein B